MIKIPYFQTKKYASSKRHVEIKEDGKVILAADVSAPDSWNDNAISVAARTYFRTIRGKREDSIFGMVHRAVSVIATAAYEQGLVDNRDNFYHGLFDMVIDQRFAWNTPVWVNAGAELPEGERPQCSACFIQAVDDDMVDLMNLQTSETLLFRRGSGTGTNVSPLRPRGAALSRGGQASGPVSFMRGFDAWAGVTKSGGSSRRAAKMVVMNVDHPEILDFIACKVTAEQMKRSLAKDGWATGLNDIASMWLPYQNANNSVRVTNAFMNAVWMGEMVKLVHGGKEYGELPARQIWERLYTAAWDCGDPGIQFDDTINEWHCTPSAGRINASNPCSEYMYLDDSACNLGSLNLQKYYDFHKGFDVNLFRQDVRLAFLSMEAIVDMAGYPTPEIAANSHRFRPLGLGYANLGALLMRLGVPYDSDAGRAVAASITSLLGGTAYEMSAEIARDCGGPFEGYTSEMLRVIAKHEVYAESLAQTGAPHLANYVHGFRWEHVAQCGYAAWAEALRIGAVNGFRNAQATLLAPTGTIGFMMGCDTTGVEPDVGLVKSKRLASGGVLKIVNGSVPAALEALGYGKTEISIIAETLQAEESLASIEWRDPAHAKVFQTAFGDDPLTAEAHVRMVAAVQPFLSGAVSKTVNMPANCTPEDVGDIYALAHRLGVKALAIYRDGAKADQPVTVKTTEKPIAKGDAVVAKKTGPGLFDWEVRKAEVGEIPVGVVVGVDKEPATREAVDVAMETLGRNKPESKRVRMPDERKSVTRKFSINDQDFYFTVGFYPDTAEYGACAGKPGEVFIESNAQDGSMFAALLCKLGTFISIALQHGMPFSTAIDKLRGVRFEPSGFTGDSEFPTVASFLDAFARWAEKRFLSSDDAVLAQALEVAKAEVTPAKKKRDMLSGRMCRRGCGPMMQDGTCWRCPVCLDNTGGCGG